MATDEVPVPVPKKRRRERRVQRRPLKGNGAAEAQPMDGLDQREMLAALIAVKRGDFAVRLPGGLGGYAGKIADAFNDIVT